MHRFLALIGYAPMLALLCWAAAEDVRSRRIRNWLTLSLAIAGLVQSFGAHATVAPGRSALGMLAGFALPFALFAIGALGGGDVKLLAGIGAWVGPGPVLAIFAVEAVLGMVIVLGQASCSGRLGVLLRNSGVVAINIWHLNELGVEHVRATGRGCRSVDRPLPYGVPVLLATVIVLYVSSRGGML